MTLYIRSAEKAKRFENEFGVKTVVGTLAELEKLEKELCDEQATAARLDEERHVAVTKCAELEKQLEEERLIASSKYTELEAAAFEERDRYALSEKALEEDKARLKAECDEWRT